MINIWRSTLASPCHRSQPAVGSSQPYVSAVTGHSPSRTNCHQLTLLVANELISLPIITGPPTHSVGGQTSNGRWCLSASVVCCRLSSVTLLAGRPAGRPSGAWAVKRLTAGQYGYVPLGRHLVLVVQVEQSLRRVCVDVS